MIPTRSERWGRRLAYGLLILSLGVLAGTSAIAFSPSLRARAGLGGTPVPGYAIGDAIDLPAQYFNAAPQTLVLFVSGTCGATVRSASLLGGIADHLKATSTRVVIFSPADRAADQALLARRMGLDRAAFIPVDLTQYRVRIVPTAVLVDQRGRVRYVQEGAVGLSEQQAILDAAGAATPDGATRTGGGA